MAKLLSAKVCVAVALGIILLDQGVRRRGSRHHPTGVRDRAPTQPQDLEQQRLLSCLQHAYHRSAPPESRCPTAGSDGGRSGVN
jgi:hypothetical protein